MGFTLRNIGLSPYASILSDPPWPGCLDWRKPRDPSERGPQWSFSAIALFFRIYLSPKGRTVLLLVDSPEERRTFPDGCNVLLHDNKELAEYLFDFILKLPAFAALPACESLSLIPMEQCRSEGDPRSRYSESSNPPLWKLNSYGMVSEHRLRSNSRRTHGGKENELYTLLIESLIRRFT